MIRPTPKHIALAFAGLLGVGIIALGLGAWFLSRGPVALDAVGPTIKASFAESFAPLRIDFINPTLVWVGEERTFRLRVDQVEIFDAEEVLVADVPQAIIGISADALLRGIVAPSRIEFAGATALLIRRRDGGVQLGLSTPTVDAAGQRRPQREDVTETLGIVQSILDLLLEEPEPGTRAGYLTEFVIRDSTLRFFDAPTSSFWRAPDGYLAFARDEDGVSLHLDADVEVGGRDWSLDVAGIYDPAEGFGSLQVEFADFNPSDVAAAVPALASLQGIDLPIQGSASLDMSATGEILSADLSVTVGSGEFGLPGFFDEPVPVDDATFVGSFRPKDKAAEIQRLTYHAGDNSTNMSGTVVVETREDEPWIPVAVDLDIVAEDLSVFVTSLQDRPIVYEQAAFRGRFDQSRRTITIRNFNGVTQGASVELSGRISDETGDLEILLDGSATDVPTSAILAYWPTGKLPGARNWLNRNLLGGMARDVEFHMDIPAGTLGNGRLPNEAYEVSFTFDQGETTFVTGLPVMTEGRGYATLQADILDLTLEHGMIGDIEVHSGHMLLDNMQVLGSIGVFNAVATGPAEQVLNLLDSGPFDYPTRYGISPQNVSGIGSGSIEIRMPMLSRPPWDQISFSATAEVTEFAMADVAPNVDLTDGTLALLVDRSSLRARGDVAMNGVPADFTWRENFENRERPSQFTVAAELSDSDRIRLGMDFGSALVGPVGVEISTEGRGRQLSAVDIHADLGQATVLIPRTEWIKPAGEIAAARLEFGFPEAGGLEVRDLIFAGDRVLVRGDFAIGESGRLDFAELERIRLDGLIDVSLSAHRDDNGGLALMVDGEHFNAAPFMEQFTRAEDQGAGLPFSVEGSIGTLTMLREVDVNNVEFFVLNDGVRITEMSLLGTFDDGAIVHSTMSPTGAASRDFVVTTTNAGELMKGLLGFESIAGGNLVLDVAMRDDAEETAPDVELAESEPLTPPRDEDLSSELSGDVPQDLAEIEPPTTDRAPARSRDEGPAPAAVRTRGTLTVENFHVVQAPVLAQLLSLGSLQGLSDTLSGDGILFQILELPFYAHGGVIGFEGGHAHGSAIGLTLEGEIDRDRNVTDLAGTIVPAYDINSFLGNVPVLGEIFVSREGEGVIAFTYGIVGPADNPQIFVNPLSALTPGLFRRIFSGNPRRVIPPELPEEATVEESIPQAEPVAVPEETDPQPTE